MLEDKNLSRLAIINSVLDDLREFKSSCSLEQQYAVDENIKFFEAAKHLWRYIPWLIRQYPKIDKTRIKELADFHLRDGLWEENLLRNLIRLEKSPFIDLVGPLRNEIVKQMRDMSAQSKRPLVVVNVGCGAMEIERQVIDRLVKSPLSVPVAFIGIDNSEAALTMAWENLHSHHEFFNESRELSPELITKITQSDRPYAIQFVVGDVFSLSNIPSGTVDLVYYSKFLHHLSDRDKGKFKELLIKISSCVIEFDDYRGWYLPIMSLLTNWRQPVLLNGAVFSSLRVPSCAELQWDDCGTKWTTKILSMKGYLKVYQRRSSG